MAWILYFLGVLIQLDNDKQSSTDPKPKVKDLVVDAFLWPVWSLCAIHRLYECWKEAKKDSYK